jgi:TRAP-type C4-dicarboxylate transport system permease small subunit
MVFLGIPMLIIELFIPFGAELTIFRPEEPMSELLTLETCRRFIAEDLLFYWFGDLHKESFYD